MNIEQAKKLAKEAAAADFEHSYTQVEDFEPHRWVVIAILKAHTLGLMGASE